MASFNKVLLMGNLTRDPALKYLQSGTALVEFGIAVNRRWKDQDGEEREEVAFVDCAAFGKTAEVIDQYFTKGKPIFIEGRLKFDQWEDKNGGGKRSKLSVIVDHFQFIGARDDDGEKRDEQQEYQRPPQRQQNRQPQRSLPPARRERIRTPADESPFGNAPPKEDIPF